MGILTRITTIGLILAGLSTVTYASSTETVAKFPEAEKGFIRQVIHLAPLKGENDYKVEIMAGKILTVDCNRQRLGGTLEKKNLEGWGYSFYRLERVTGPMSTRMACPDNKTTEDFVPVLGDGFLLNYNSKLPIVLYAPEDIEVRYRIWSASSKIENAAQE